MIIPNIYREIKLMFQTTNQFSLLHPYGISMPQAKIFELEILKHKRRGRETHNFPICLIIFRIL